MLLGMEFLDSVMIKHYIQICKTSKGKKSELLKAITDLTSEEKIRLILAVARTLPLNLIYHRSNLHNV